MFDYATLRVIWWLLLGTLLIGFTIMDGFDLGAAMLLPFLGRNDTERRIVINTIAPVWEGNQVWFVLGAGVIFAAWPTLYAVSFSGFYLVMMAILLTFILRPVALKYRSKMPGQRWRSFWDWVLCGCGFAAALLFGVAVGNVIQGVPFHFDESMRSFYTGTLWQLLNPFALLSGVLSVMIIAMQGGFYVAMKTTELVRNRAIRCSRIAALSAVTLFLLAGYQLLTLKGYVVTSAINPLAASNPMHKTVAIETGAWLHNYIEYPWMRIGPIMGVFGALTAFMLARIWHSRLAFICSSLSIIGIIATVGLSLFPFLLPSSSDPTSSLLVWDTSSSEFTLGFLLFVTVLFLPIILAYTSWVYWVLRGKITHDVINAHDKTMY